MEPKAYEKISFNGGLVGVGEKYWTPNLCSLAFDYNLNSAKEEA